MTNLGLFDCDTHCYEPRDAFTRYLPSEFADRAILPARNGPDLDDVPEAVRDRMTFHLAEDVSQVLEWALEDAPSAAPLEATGS